MRTESRPLPQSETRSLRSLGLKSILGMLIACHTAWGQDQGYLVIDNVPNQITINATTLVSGTPGHLTGSASVTYTAHANIPWTVTAGIVPASNLPSGVVPTVSAPTQASGPATGATAGTVNVTCTAPLTLGPVSAGDKIQVGVITLTIAAGL